MSGSTPVLVCGVAGTALDAGERELLVRLGPGGVILFARNVESREQLAALTGELRALPSHPAVAVDLEGGRVNRLRPLLGELPSPGRAAAAGAEAVRALGEAAGLACAHFGIDLDYAPVVDVARPGGWLTAEDRCLGAAPLEVAGAAAAYLEGLEASGVRGCLKHFPGLGSGRVDSHRELPVLDDEVVADGAVFRRLAAPRRAVMVAHAVAPALGEPLRPASLSEVVVAPLAAGPSALVVADDLEMGALARFGSLGERAAAALLAGCDQVLVCNALVEREAVAAHLAAWRRRSATLDARMLAAEARVAAFGQARPAAVSWERVEAAAARARRLVEVPA